MHYIQGYIFQYTSYMYAWFVMKICHDLNSFIIGSMFREPLLIFQLFDCFCQFRINVVSQEHKKVNLFSHGKIFDKLPNVICPVYIKFIS